MDFISTIDPYRIDPEKYWLETRVDNPKTLKPVPDRDIIIMVGDAWNVLDDLEKWAEFGATFDVMAMNYSHQVIPKSWGVHHYAAGDSHTAAMQDEAAKLNGGKTLRHCWNRGSKNFDIRWGRNTSKGWTGTSANLGLKVAIALGYMKIVLVGCPMDGGGNWYTGSLPDYDTKKHKDHTAHLWKWTELAGRPIGRFIRSMSGNTAHLFGEPDDDWLFKF